MSVLSRPLFRQMGGPAQPMPQDMAPAPPPMAPPQPQMDPEMARQAGVLEKTEMEARASGEQLGAEYAQNMMAGIDGAQSTEDLINALRGNDKPLDARREELAGYVGQGDADQTPESVLAMVQPVIMMTEEGAMDSGIGALVQQITGDVEMTTADGAPTDMGMGVGSLMMAGAPEAPAPQNFRQGGEVAHLNDGSNPIATAPSESYQDLAARMLSNTGSNSLMSTIDPDTLTFKSSDVKTRYEELMPLFQNIVSLQDRETEAEEQANMDKAQAMLALARGGLRLAAGDPKSGGSLASQIGSAFEPTAAEIAALGAQAQERKNTIRAQDRELRASGLQAALGIEENALANRQALSLAQTKARADMLTRGRDERVVLDNQGNEIAVLNLNNPVDSLTYDMYQMDGNYNFRKMTSGGAQQLTNLVIRSPEGDVDIVESFTPGTYIDDEGKERPVSDITSKGFTVTRQPPEGIAEVQRSIGIEKKYKDILRDYEAGKLAPSESVILGKSAANSIAASAATLEQRLKARGFNDEQIAAWIEGEGELKNIAQSAQDLERGRRFAYDAAMNATGPIARFNSGLNSYIGFLTDLDPEDREREEQAAYLRAVRFVGKVALVSNSRFPVAEMALASDLFPNPDAFFTDAEVEAQKLQVIKSVTDQLYEFNLRELASGSLDKAQRREAEASLREIELLRSLLGEVPNFGEEQFQSNRFNFSGQRTESENNTPGGTGMN